MHSYDPFSISHARLLELQSYFEKYYSKAFTQYYRLGVQIARWLHTIVAIHEEAGATSVQGFTTKFPAQIEEPAQETTQIQESRAEPSGDHDEKPRMLKKKQKSAKKAKRQYLSETVSSANKKKSKAVRN